MPRSPGVRPHHAGKRENIDAGRVGGKQRAGAFLDRGAGRKHVVDQHDPAARDLAAVGVRVNTVAPGLIEGTRMAARLPRAVVDRARAGVVLGRTSSAVDIAEQVVTFCRADSVTGQVLVVDGGMLFH